MSDAAAVARAAPSPRVTAWRGAAFVALGAIVLLGLAWELGLAPTGRGTLALKVVPLLLAVPGMTRHRLRTFRWLSLLLWIYVAEGALRASTERGASQVLATAQLVLAIALFAACVGYIRTRLRARTA